MTKSYLLRLLVVILLCLPGWQCTKGSSEKTGTLRIFAAASLTPVMPKLRDRFLKTHPGVRFEFNFAASSILAKQIAYGAAADIFVSARPDWVDYLEKKDLIEAGNRFEFLSNKLVIIIPKTSRLGISTVRDLLNPAIERIALADWSNVPAGIYAMEALHRDGIWKAVEPKCIPALDVRAALTYVERGEVDCGIVYRTDAMLSEKVKIALQLPESIQPKIRYSVAIIGQENQALARSFVRFLMSDAAKGIFEKYGFIFFEQDIKE